MLGTAVVARIATSAKAGSGAGTSRRAGYVAGIVTLASLVAAGTSTAAKPSLERYVYKGQTEFDETLSRACLVDVWSTVRGHVIWRRFDEDRKTGPTIVYTINLGFTATYGDNVFRYRSTGSQVTGIQPDGTTVIRVSGQRGTNFTGTLKMDLDTGVVLHEPHFDHGRANTARACATLTR